MEKKKTEIKEADNTANLGIGVVISRFFVFLISIIIVINIGKWIGIGLFKFIMWLGILPQLEKIFGLFIF